MEFRKDKMIFLKDDVKHTFMLNGYYPAGQSEYKTAHYQISINGDMQIILSESTLNQLFTDEIKLPTEKTEVKTEVKKRGRPKKTEGSDNG